MKLFFPQNVFSRLIAAALPPEINADISYYPSSVISAELEKNVNAVGLIPCMDLIKHNDFFVSKKFGLSFEDLLCNSYLYYGHDQRDLKDLYLSGDVSSQEVILSKIIFKELYNSEADVHLLRENNPGNINLVITGDQNFAEDKYLKGVTFSEEVIEILNLPYVNYVFAGLERTSIEQFHDNVPVIEDKIYLNIDESDLGAGLSELSAEFIRTNIASLTVDFDESDIEGLEQLVRLPYFYGMIKDIVEVKYI